MHPQQKLIDGFRELADFLEANPAPRCLRGCYRESWNLFVETKEELAEAARWLGSCTKEIKGDSYFYLSKKFGHISIEVNIERPKVCERIKVGERVIPARTERVIPAQVLPAEPEKVEEVYEWKCPESILQPEIDTTPDVDHVCETADCPGF